MIRELSRLLGLRRTLFRNIVLFSEKGAWNRWLTIAILACLFVVGDYIFFHRIIEYLAELPFQAGDELIPQLLNVVFLTLFVMGAFSGVIVSLSLFYMAPDLELLHSLPLSPTSILTSRFFQCVVHSSWMMLLFSLPIYAAYGNHFQATVAYYMYVVAALAPFFTIACALGSMATLVLLRYFPSRRLHQMLSLIGLVFLVGLITYLRFLSPEKFFGKNVSDAQIMLFVEKLQTPDYPFLPSSWITLGVTQARAGDWGGALWNFSYLMIAAVFAVAGLLFLGKKIYLQGWRLAGEARTAPLDDSRADGNGHRSRSVHPIRALWDKDLKLFFRDPEQWSQLFILAALTLVYLFNIINLPLDNRVLQHVVAVLNVGLIGFVLSALSARFVFSAPSMEGAAFWTIYSSPTSMKSFLWGKFCFFFPPLLFIAELLAGVSSYLLEVDAYVMAVSIVGTFFITLALTGLGLGLGAMYPMFKHDNVAEISSGTGGILFMVFSLAYIGVLLALGARPVYVHFNETFLSRSLGGWDVPICYAATVLLTLFVAWWPMHKGERALQKMDL
ncbi:MAG: hypothetical protein G3M78_12175 [Candidatus Nitrohelix vancouverensis]|uniref:Uncharacterized protein n=1 Tax=Candidatus Nitrohelix vancouverensis TaxID=2705534 RepID=A0A7T0G473_9BACT|nr:MAG: hypothetical protein G3M78_12175 [Candidatus Nitrohelix vancouverensis]